MTKCIEYLRWMHGLALSWQRSLSYRNQSIDLVCKSIDKLLYYRDLYRERVKSLKHWYDTKNVYDMIQRTFYDTTERTFMIRRKERLWYDTKNVIWQVSKRMKATLLCLIIPEGGLIIWVGWWNLYESIKGGSFVS